MRVAESWTLRNGCSGGGNAQLLTLRLRLRLRLRPPLMELAGREISECIDKREEEEAPGEKSCLVGCATRVSCRNIAVWM